jgi:hypothetical protein
MAKPLIALCLTICSLSAGCSSLQPCRFWVTGRITDYGSEGQPPRDRVVAEIGTALKPLGFSDPHVMPNIEPELVVYTLGQGFALVGDRIDVRFEPTSMSVSVRDYNQTKESAVDKQVVDAIQGRIATVFHATIQFQPVTRCIL